MRKTLALASLAALFAGASAEARDFRFASSSKTPLTDEEEVQDPPVVSDGAALGFIRFDDRFRRAFVRVTFSNLEGEVSRLHLHCNVAGQNGPIAIGLIDLVAAGNDNSENVRLDANTIEGVITNRDFPDVDPCPGAIGRDVNDLRSLANAINDGEIYWNLHTFAFPAGELRGQVQPLAVERSRGGEEARERE